MNYIEVICANCDRPFYKTVREYNRSERRGKSHCCSTSCAAVRGNKIPRRRHYAHLRDCDHGQYDRDRLTPFRYLFKVAKRHSTEKAKGRLAKKFSITLDDLLEQWEKQGGKCPYTGWWLHLPVNASGKWNGHHLKKASIDRIDSDAGYVRGNVQFVARIANYAKHRFSDEDLLVFCEAVVVTCLELP